jgi:alkylated DNA repair dioxygenase AlkB
MHGQFMDWVNSSKLNWERAIEGRRVIQFGPVRYGYTQQAVVDAPDAQPIPDTLKEIFFGFIPKAHQEALTQCIINEYTAEDEIPFHTDDSRFGEHIYVFCLCTPRPLLLRRLKDTKSTVPEYEEWTAGIDSTERCMYVLSGDARHQWEHSVPLLTDSDKGGPDGVRVSVTFRSVLVL